ncbi:unnamed protein product [Rodentolepis nana]|uniref:Calponin-homology (CH) domain-containing protein n=1 Tax=Rodentolepis nana TaxID=102285 RepID=A0A0R3T3Q4_RODNA|nr:unnamed protein product [Rodentolepis nana]
MHNEIDQQVLRDLYSWVDSIPLSRPKKNISRDFSDGVLVAEVVKYFFPKYVDLHNFQSCNKIEGKRNNWQLLNWKVFSKFSFKITDDVVDSLINAQPRTIEKLLLLLRSKFQEYENSGEVNDTRILPLLSNQNGVSKVITSTSIPHRLQRLPTVWNENRNIERGVPSLYNKISISQKPVSKTTSGSKPANGSSWRQPNSTNGYPESVSNDLLQSYDQKVQECFKLQEAVDILNAKLRRMQHLLELKDLRINELQKRLQFFH